MAGLIPTLNSAADYWWAYVLHASWQAALVAAVAVAAVTLGRRLPSQWRYALLLVVLIKFATPPFFSKPFGLFFWAPVRADLPSPVVNSPQRATSFPAAGAGGPWQPPRAVREPSPAPSPTATDTSFFYRTWVGVTSLGGLNWKFWLMLIHAIVAFALLAWMVKRSLRIALAVGRARRMDKSPLFERVKSLANRLDLRDEGHLVTAAEPRTLIGTYLLRPKVYVSDQFVVSLTGPQQDALLAYQLVHHRRNDYAVNYLQMLLLAAWWFNPFIWLTHFALLRTRWECCDDAVVGSNILEPKPYVEARRTASELCGEPTQPDRLLGLVEPMAPSPERTARLLRPHFSPSPKLAGEAFIAVALLAILIFPGIQSDRLPWGQQSVVATPPPDVLLLTVVSAETQKPIASAQVTAQQAVLETASDGTAQVRYNAQNDFGLIVTAQAPGHVPMQVQYQKEYRSPQSPLEVPQSLTLALPPASSIGGIIRNEQGEGVENVQVTLTIPGAREGFWGTGRDNGQPRVALSGTAILTDSQGRWRCDVVPQDLKTILFRLTHADYLSDESFGQHTTPPLAELRDMTAVLVMKRGLTLEGVVLDDEGNPLDDATVRSGDPRMFSYPGGPVSPSASTDEQGRFEMTKLRPGPVTLTVQHEKFASKLLSLRVREGNKPLEIRLEKGLSVRGRVTDTAGKPLRGAQVSAELTRSGGGQPAFQAFTDEDGYFLLERLPRDTALAYSVTMSGYMSKQNLKLNTGDELNEITLAPPLRVSGTVTDAETGKPVTRFAVVQGISWGRSNNPAPYWERFNITEQDHPDGRYETAFTYPRDGHYVRIEAPGYAPAVSRMFTGDEGEVAFDFKLKKGAGLSGVVRSPDGKPVADAQVTLAIPGQMVYVMNGLQLLDQGNVTTTTGADGGYSLPAQEGVWIMVVLHESGYAQVEDSHAPVAPESPDVTLKPWGRVEGTVMNGDKPAVGERVSLVLTGENYDAQRPRVHFQFEAVTDGDGRFAIENVSAGKAFVSRQIKLNETVTGYTQSTPVTVEGGETAKVKIGGTGRPVVGRVTQPEGEPLDLSHANASLQAPTRIEANPALNRVAQSVQSLLAGKSSVRKPPAPVGDEPSLPSATFVLEPDGTFQIPDVPAGTYQLSIQFYVPQDPLETWGKTVGMVNKTVTVPPIPTGRSDDPIDLGDLPIQRLRSEER